MINLNNLCNDLTRFASEKGYIIEMRINSQVSHKVELYTKTTDTLPISEYPLQEVYSIIGCFALCDRIVIYNDLLVFDITRL